MSGVQDSLAQAALTGKEQREGAAGQGGGRGPLGQCRALSALPDCWASSWCVLAIGLNYPTQHESRLLQSAASSAWTCADAAEGRNWAN